MSADILEIARHFKQTLIFAEFVEMYEKFLNKSQIDCILQRIKFFWEIYIKSISYVLAILFKAFKLWISLKLDQNISTENCYRKIPWKINFPWYFTIYAPYPHIVSCKKNIKFFKFFFFVWLNMLNHVIICVEMVSLHYIVESDGVLRNFHKVHELCNN